MRGDFRNDTRCRKALIYCRVSSKKQTADGSGLHSQEHRCRAYAAEHGYDVEAVFPDDVSGGGDFMRRPGMVALLRYLDDNSGERYVVIFDDLKRYARDTLFHLALRAEMEKRGASRECLNFNFDDTPEGKFVETIFAAQSELEREQNGRQVVQKMRARVEQGFWCFRAPIGFKYVQGKRGGKVLVHDELAPVVKEALEGFATGRFQTQAEVGRFLELCADFPKDAPEGKIRPQTIARFLRKEVYAGLVSAPAWGVSPRPGQHEGIITLQTFERIQARLNEEAYAPQRSDLNTEFPLRGAIACASCGTPLTAGMCKGKYRKYPYYFCRKKGCTAYGKAIRREKIEGEFRALLDDLRPSALYVNALATLFRDAWDRRMEIAAASLEGFQREAALIEKKIAELVDRVVDATNARVVSAYEDRIETLERERLILAEKAAQVAKPRYSFETLFELSLRFLANPCSFWDSGLLSYRRLLLRLTFSETLAYCRESGFRTPNTTLPFKALGSFFGCSGEMVLLERIELSTSPLPRECSTPELQQRATKGGGRIARRLPREKARTCG